MRVAIQDDIHNAYESAAGVRRLRERVELRIFTGPFGDPGALEGFDALVANGEPDDLLRASDVVSVHATLAPETRGLLDARRIGLMKPTAYLINTARGPIVDEAALVAALAQGRIAGAGLDVFDREPLPAGHPLARLTNVILTPHLGWPTDEAYECFADAAADALLAYLDGRDVPRFAEQH